MSEPRQPPPIAVVGMGCEYPDAHSPAELWENVLAGRRAFRRLPSERLRLEDYWSADRGAEDGLYATEAAVIKGYEFDRVAARVPGRAYRAADLTHWLALDVALRALADAGLEAGEGLPRDTTGVLLGNTLTGELTRAGSMRLRWPYVRRVLDATLRDEAIEDCRRAELLRRVEAAYKAPFEPVGDETLAGSLSNTIAGRICNHLDLHGGGYTVDAACAASLLATITACERLATGELDVALAGGVDVSMDPFELVGFAKAGALAGSEMRVYDQRSEGFWPGEGCGMVVLMRLADALADRRHVHAVVRGWGVSSDGAGGITRPELSGQLLAISRAYARARVDPAAIGYFEGHGTGTPVGDATELRALSAARQEAAGPAVVGSIKANIGHTKAAAGVAGLIKATLAVREGALPPTPGCERPHRELESGALRVLAAAEPWTGSARLAGVSAMGFGGINTHAVVAAPPGAPVRTRLTARERMLTASAQDAEVFLFAARTRTQLLRQVERLQEHAAGLSRAEMADAAAAVATDCGPGAHRAAVVAARPADLAGRLGALSTLIHDGTDRAIDASASVFLGGAERTPRLGLLFPGQGSPAADRGNALRRRFPLTEALLAAAPLVERGADPVDTEHAQPAIVTASLAALRVLEALGIEAEVAVGHSVGELSALAWAGALGDAAAQRLAAERGRAMSALAVSGGAMAGVELDRAAAESLADGLALVVAAVNGPTQTVLSGASDGIEAVLARARRRGVRAARLPVSHAFHSPLVAPAADALAAVLEGERLRPVEARVVSTVTGEVIGVDADLRDLLVRQVTAPVQFHRAVGEASTGLDLLVESGPGAVLTGLVNRFSGVPAISVDAGGPSLDGLLKVTGAAWALGARLQLDPLFGDRFTRALDLDRKPRFIANPCESPPPCGPLPQVEANPIASTDREPVEATPAGGSVDDPLELVRALVAERSELPVDAVTDESRLLDDLHMNSIAVSEVAVEAAGRLRLPPPLAPNEFANATVAELAQAITETSTTSGGTDPDRDIEPPGAGPWVRAFSVEWVERPRSGPPQSPSAAGDWRVLAPPGDPLARQLRDALTTETGTAVLLPPGPIDDDGVRMLLEAAQTAGAARGPHVFLMVHSGSGATGFARCLHDEAPSCRVCLLDAPRDDRIVERAVLEAAAVRDFADVRYTADGIRCEPALRPVPDTDPAPAAPLGAGDVLLVTGGAKGIAAECALRLARDTNTALGLIGRTDPASDAAARANLERIAAAGVKVAYAIADITNAEAVAAAVRRIAGELGEVTALLHAAGSNEPRLIDQLDADGVRAAVAPKVDGLRHLLDALDAGRLRLLVTFGSIIARAGMRGEAHYALANELQTGLTERFAAEHPHCACLAFESSVWAGIGMGQRLGAVSGLARRGVQAIAPEEGARILARLVARRSRPVAVVVAARVGRSPRLRFEDGDLPLGRFLERTPVHYPGVELVADAEVSSDVDPYLRDHVLEGEQVLPAVLALEAMAQAATALDRSDRPAFEDVRFARAVVVPPGEAVTVRVAALAAGDDGAARVVVRSGRTRFAVDHVTASWRRAAEVDAAIIDLPAADDDALELDPGDLYGSLFFQDGRFRRVRRYLRLTATECVAEIEPAEARGWYGPFLPQELTRGDPGARDAALHALQACIPHARVIPVAVAAVRPGVGDPPGPWLLRARERERSGDELLWDLALFAADGRLIERWDGLRLRAVAPVAVPEPWPKALLATYLERRLEGLDRSLRVAVGQRGDSRRERSDAAIGRALGGPVTVRRRPDGRPELDGGLGVSTAHANGMTLAVAGAAPVACDVEEAQRRPLDVWRGLLGADREALSETIASGRGEDISTAATRVWAAGECLQKIGLPAGAPLAVADDAADGWLLLACGERCVATYVTQVSGFAEPVALAVLAGGRDGRL